MFFYLTVLCIIFDQLFASFHIWILPPRNYVSCLLLLIVFTNLKFFVKKLLSLPKSIKNQFLLIFVFSFVVLISSLFHSYSIGRVFNNTVSTLLVPFLTYMTAVVFINKKENIKLLIYVSIACVTISAFVAVMQFFNVELFWQIRMKLADIDKVYKSSYIIDTIVNRRKIPGMTLYSVTLSYQLVTMPAILLSIFFADLRYSFATRLLLIFCFIIILGGLLVSEVRSAVLGQVLALGFVMIKYHKNIASYLVVILLLSIIYFYGIPKLNDIDFKPFQVIVNRLSNYDDESAKVRKPAALIALKILIGNPIFGVNVYQYTEIAEKYSVEIEENDLNRSATQIAPHNSWLNMGVTYGIFSILIALIFYIKLYKILTIVERKSNDTLLKSVSIGIKSGAIAYFVNNFFHNASIFNKEYYNITIVFIAWFVYTTYNSDKESLYKKNLKFI